MHDAQLDDFAGEAESSRSIKLHARDIQDQAATGCWQSEQLELYGLDMWSSSSNDVLANFGKARVSRCFTWEPFVFISSGLPTCPSVVASSVKRANTG